MSIGKIFQASRSAEYSYVLVTLFILCVMYWFKLSIIDNRSVGTFPTILTIATVVSFVLSWLRYPDSSRSFKVLLRGVSLTLGLYIMMNWSSYAVPNHLLSNEEYLAFKFFRWVAIVFALLSIWRPSFAILPLLYTVYSKHLTAAVGQHQISPTDYLPLVEIGVFLFLSVVITGVTKKIAHEKIQLEVAHESRGQLAFFDVITLTAVGVHFGNYFWSAIAKAILDGNPFTWVLENKTYYLTLVALEKGVLPVSQWPLLVEILYEFSVSGVVVLNFIIFLAQLYSVLAITNIRQTIILTIFYDVTHVAIFLLSGIFFWKWILLNLVIVASLSFLRERVIPTGLKIYCALVVLLGNSIFFTTYLGWYDTPTFNHVKFVAILEGGGELHVPTNYFLSSSITIAQGRIGAPGQPIAGHPPVLTYGTVFDKETKDMAESCSLPLLPAQGVLHKKREENFDRLENFLKRHHNFVVKHANEKGRINYDWYPHHIWSNPFEFSEFAKLDKRLIKGYAIMIESVCLEFSEGKIQSREIAVTRRDFDVSP